MIWNYIEIAHPKNIAEIFNSYFSGIPEHLLKKHWDKRSNPQSHLFQMKAVKLCFCFQ